MGLGPRAAALAAFGAIAGFVGHQLDQHPRVQAAITKAALEVDEEGTRYLAKLGFSCGVERWSVKTLTDPAAGQVDLTRYRTNIPTLVSYTPPATIGPRSAPNETHVWQLSGTRLIGYKLEPDSDIHLVLRSTLGSHPTMIAEIPDPGCAAGSRVLGDITQARADFVREIGPPQTYFVDVNDSVTVAGVGFFDFPHGQRGVAANAFELHPVVALRRNP